MDRHKGEDKYIIGDLLWAKIGSYPYWPCMVSYDPYEGCYFKTKKAKSGKVTTLYHVQYFGKQVQHGWTSPGLIFAFEGENSYYNRKVALREEAQTASGKRKVLATYRIPSGVFSTWKVAVTEAEAAFAVEIKERYESFVFKYDPNLKKSALKNGNLKKNKTAANKSKARKPYAVDQAICRICEKGDVDLDCAGSCLQRFHKECLGLINAPQDFKCINCEDGLDSCFACKKSDASVFKCSKCDYHYHKDCMKKFACANLEKKICPFHTCFRCYTDNPRNISSKGPFVSCIHCPTTFHAAECVPVGCVRLTPSLLICPDHFLGKKKVSPQPICNIGYCTLCSDGGDLICCETCPISYHVNCLDTEVPDGDFFCEDCTKRQFLYVGMLIWAKSGQYRWWPAQILRADDLPFNVQNKERYDAEFPIQFFGTDEYYWTHMGRVFAFLPDHLEYCHGYCKLGSSKLDVYYKISLEEATEAYDAYIFQRQKQSLTGKPDVYRHIKVNRMVPPAQFLGENNTSFLPCLCKPNKPNPCAPGGKCLNQTVFVECHPQVCLSGLLCENQKFQRREYAKVSIFQTESCGWGLKSDQVIQAGDFVIEYVGEIITHEEYRRRAIDMRENNVQNYYFLYLDARRMIDAGPSGNLSRFINHSCDPNCEMVKWLVSGDSRIGIFATKLISKGEELSFNYHSDTVHFEQKCYCGSRKCAGVIGRKSEKQSQKKLKMK